MAEAFYKKELRELAALPENKRCVDCGAPSPQWASVQHGTLICLECSGIHRSFGVHISFVRSTTMDKWTPEQLTKLRNGGNAAFNEFVTSYPSSNNGGYPAASELKKIINNAEGTQGGGAGGMSAGGASAGVEKGRVMREKYGCWAVKEYREKLAALSADPPTDWSPSPAPADFTTLLPAPAALAPPGPANGTRARGGRGSPMPSVSSGGNGRSASPFGSAGGANGGGGGGGGNEDFFARMGEANAQRKEGLPPSQGGKYTGFGSTPDPPASSQSSSHPSFALSSHAAPSLSEFQTAPLSALTKSWGLFSSAVSSAGKEIHSSVIQPGVARAGQTLAGEGDGGYEARELAARVAEQAKATTGWLSSMAGEGWTNLNQLANQHTAGGPGGGLDFTERLGQMGLGPTGSSIAQDHQQGGKYDRVSGHGDGWNDDGFTDDWDAPKAQPQKPASAPASKAGGKGKQAEPEWDDEWKEF